MIISNSVNVYQPRMLTKAQIARNAENCFLEAMEDECEEEQNVREVQLPKEVGGSADNSAEEEAQTKIFVNAQGERILAIKTGLGYKYLKIGYEDPLLSNHNSN